jgi:type IX secretion system PorP/SprF family membrane protein
MKKIYIFFLGFLFVWANSSAQDPIFTQSYGNFMYSNPALVGSKEALRISMNHRLQWISAINQLAVSSFQADGNYDRWGFGVSGMFDESGPGFRYTNVNVAVSYRIWKLHKAIIQPGIQLGYMNRNMDWNKFIFYNQLDPHNGIVDWGTVPESSYLNANLFDVSFGVASQIPIERRRTQPGWLNVGMAFQHINDKDMSALGIEESLMPFKFTLQVGYLYQIYKRDSETKLRELTRLELYPNFKFEKHGTFGVFDLATYLYRRPFLVGLTLRTFGNFYNLRNANQVAANIGYEGKVGKYTSFQLSYSYDFAYTGLVGEQTPAFMTHEIALVVVLANKRKTDTNEDLKFDETKLFDFNKTQRRFSGDAAPAKTKRRLAADIQPVFYPFNFAEQPRKQ